MSWKLSLTKVTSEKSSLSSDQGKGKPCGNSLGVPATHFWRYMERTYLHTLGYSASYPCSSLHLLNLLPLAKSQKKQNSVSSVEATHAEETVILHRRAVGISRLVKSNKVLFYIRSVSCTPEVMLLRSCLLSLWPYHPKHA